MLKKIAYFAVLTSLIIAGSFSIDLGFANLSIFRILIIILAIALTITSFKSDRDVIILNNNKNRLSIEIMIIWLGYALLTIFWVKDYSIWFKEVYFLGIGIICIIIFCNVFKNSDDILICFRIIAIMIIIHNIIGWSEVITGNYLFLNSNLIYYAKVKYPVSMFGNTNDFATFLMMSVFFLYICIMNSKYLVFKSICAVTLLSSVALLIFTNSRANWVGLILGFTAFAILMMKNKKMRLLAFLIALVICMVIIFNIDLLSNYINLAIKKTDLNTSNNSVLIRINLLKNGAAFLTKTYWLGTGAGNSVYWMEHYSIYNTLGIASMHNWWMEILTNYGIFIFLLYIIFYFNLIKTFYKRYLASNNKIDRTLSLGIICCLIGYLLGGISSSSNIDTEWLWVFWAIAIAYQGIGDTI